MCLFIHKSLRLRTEIIELEQLLSRIINEQFNTLPATTKTTEIKSIGNKEEIYRNDKSKKKPAM